MRVCVRESLWVYVCVEVEEEGFLKENQGAVIRRGCGCWGGQTTKEATPRLLCEACWIPEPHFLYLHSPCPFFFLMFIYLFSY